MAIIFDMYALPTPKFLEIMRVGSSKTAEIDNFFLKEYGATVINGTWDQWQYRFTNREKYVEFCLKWL